MDKLLPELIVRGQFKLTNCATNVLDVGHLLLSIEVAINYNFSH